MQPWRYAAPTGPLVIVHHDRDLVVVDKPSGLLSIPDRELGHEDSALSRAQRVAERQHAQVVDEPEADAAEDEGEQAADLRQMACWSGVGRGLAFPGRCTPFCLRGQVKSSSSTSYGAVLRVYPRGVKVATIIAGRWSLVAGRWSLVVGCASPSPGGLKLSNRCG